MKHSVEEVSLVRVEGDVASPAGVDGDVASPVCVVENVASPERCS